MKRIVITIAAGALALAPLAPAAAVTAPTGLYTHNSPNSFSFATSTGGDPSNYNVRAEERCDKNGTLTYFYGAWEPPFDVSTATGGCTGGGGQIDSGFFQYRQSDPVRVTCAVFPGDPLDGSC